MPKVKFKARTTEEIENLDIENGSLIYNIENGKTYLDYDDERIPTGGGAGAVVSDTPPENPEENDLWVDTNDDEYLAQVDDEVSTTSTNAVQNQAITNYVKGTVLYNNTNGGDFPVTISDDYTNYDRIDVYLGYYETSFDYGIKVFTFIPAISSDANDTIDMSGNGWFSQYYCRARLGGTANKTLSMFGITQVNAANGSFSTIAVAPSTNPIKVVKVIGYKY